MELRHLRYFVAVATERNFTRAAERLGVAQPPLSRQIRDLELELGVTLFDRDHRPLRLTEAGRLLNEQAQQVLAGVEQLNRTMRSFTAIKRQRFVIGFVGSAIYGPMPLLVRRFRAASPRIEVQLVEMVTLEQIASLKNGQIDAGIGRLRLDDPAIRRDVLHEERLVIAVDADHPLASSTRPLTLADTAQDTLIVYPSQPRPSYADQVLQLYRDRGVEPADIHQVRELQTALGLVAAQAGICIVPAALRRLQRDDIVYRDIDDERAVSPVILSWRANDQSDEVRLLCEIARDLLRTETDARPSES